MKVFVCLAILGMVVYANALNHPFMLDDHVFFDEMGRDPGSLMLNFIPDKSRYLKIEGSSTETYYRPLALIVPKFFFWIFRGNVLAMHGANLLLLSTAALMLFRFCSLLGNPLIGIGAASLLIVHPINGIIVNFKTAGIFALQLIAMLAAASCLVKVKVSWQDQAKACLLMVVALFCHESSFVLPVCLWFVFYFIQRRGAAGSFKAVIPLLSIAAVYFFLRLFWASLGENLFNKFNVTNSGLLPLLAGWFKLQALYAAQLFTAKGIVISYVRPYVFEGSFDIIVIGIAVWGLLYWTLRRCCMDMPWTLTGAGWMAAGMVMMGAGSLFGGGQMMMEPHWFVFTGLGFFMALVEVVLRYRRYLAVTAAACCLVFYWAVMGRQYNALWHDEKAYCRFWLKQDPGYQPVYFFLARSYFGDGKLDEAQVYYRRALTGMYPDYLVYSNLGTIALYQGRIQEARRYLQRAVEIEPRARGALNALGVVFAREGNTQLARAYFNKSISANPWDHTAQKNMAFLDSLQPKHQGTPSGIVIKE